MRAQPISETRTPFETRPGRCGVWFAWLIVLLASGPAAAQLEPDDPILPGAISSEPIELQARYIRQWRRPDGDLALHCTGQFELTMGLRRLSANNAIVWITPRSDEAARRYYDLTVYLSEDALVREPGGTSTADQALLVSNLATYGELVKRQDAHSPENMESSPLFQRAERDRGLVAAAAAGQISRPAEVARITPRAPQREVRFTIRKGSEPAETRDGEPVQIVSGGVYLSQSGGPDSPTLEIQADRAVIFLQSQPQRRDDSGSAAESATDSAPAQSEVGGFRFETPSESPPEPDAADQGALEPPAPEFSVWQSTARAVYLEGDVQMVAGDRVVRAERLFYDFERERALILDAVLRAEVPQREVPLYVRAAEIRQLSTSEYSAESARVTTSEFFTPHYHVGAEKVYLRDRRTRDASGAVIDDVAATYELRDATLNINGLPFAYWPYSRGDVEQSETLLRRFRTGYSDNFGFEVQTAWHLFNLLGAQPPAGVDATLHLDYFGDRGPAAGVDFDYESTDNFGLFRSYYISDQGEDNLGPLRDNEPDTENRGRLLWRHRHYLPNDWELTLEFAYASDPGFLEEYEKSEWFEGKDQETVVYLKRAGELDAVTLLANWRLLDFVTQTEHLPDLTYRRIGDTFLDPLVTYHESRVGAVRYRTSGEDITAAEWIERLRIPNDQSTDTTFRADARQEAELPIKLPGGNLVPFSTVRGSYWDSAPTRSGGLWRGIGIYGVRGSSTFSRIFDDVRSELFDINRARHIIKPKFVAWWAHSNARSELITPFDEGVETIDDFYGAMIGVDQTLQTKRGAPGRERTVDLLTLNLEAGFFGKQQQELEQAVGYVNPLRPEDSRTRNYAAGEFTWRVSDTTALLYDFNIDLNDREFDRHDLSFAVERSPRTSYVFGWRSSHDAELGFVGGGFNYRYSEKHIGALRYWHDIDRNALGELSITYIRKLPRWYMAVTLEIDEVFDDTRLSISLWPEGLPEWTLGSRRFTGLATSTGIRP